MKIPLFVRALVLFAAASAAFAPTVTAQQNWRWANSLPASVQWNGVAYGNGLYVAVGLDATIATSPDAVTWTIQRMNTAQMTLNSVAYANGLFVAAGMGTSDSVGAALIMTSPDGINWTINTTMANNNSAQFTNVVYGGGTWLVDGSSYGVLFTSTDGLAWTPHSIATDVIPGRGTYGAGKFVISLNNNTVMTSADGITWTRLAVVGVLGDNGPYIYDVKYGGGQFVAVGRDKNFNGAAYTSTDGTTWTAAPTIASSSNGFISVATDGTTFVAAGGAGVFSSANGTDWTKQTSALPTSARQLGPQSENVSAASFANGKFFVLGIYGSITTSTDGATWTRRSTGTVNDLGGLLHDGTRFIASGSGGTILTSTDGTAWTQVTTGSTGDLYRLAYSGTRYAAAGYSGIYQSTNLTSWTQVSGTGFDRYNGMIYGNSKFVAFYDATTLGVRTSADGLTWSSAVNIAGAGGNTVGTAFGSGTFVIAMSGFGSTTPKIFSSTDGTIWTDRTPSAMAGSPESIAYGNGRFVILNAYRQALTSTDGINWTVTSLSSLRTLSSIQFVGNEFVARSNHYGAAYFGSTDGINWAEIENSYGPNGILTLIVAHDSTVVSISSSGMILRGDLAAAVAPPAPTITSQPATQSTSAGSTVTFSVVANGGALTYQWKLNGTGLLGATTASLTLTNVQAADAGSYTVDVTNSAGTTTSAGAVLTVTPASNYLANLSVRAAMGVGQTLIVGFVVDGGAKPVLVRAAGPVLNNYGLTGVVDPSLALYNGGSVVASNNDWDSSLAATFAALGAFAFDAGSKDAALQQSISGPHTAQATATGAGSILVEAYDAGANNGPKLVNLSTRFQVGTGDNILIAGFVLTGTGTKNVLVRAVGPTLASYGVTGTLVDPQLAVYDGGTMIASNDNWSSSLTPTFDLVGAFHLLDASKDAALVVTLQAGKAYTVQVSGVGSTTGEALIEIYAVP